MVVLPVTYDQPGVGARVECAGVGRSIPVARLSLERLRVAVRTVLDDPAYRVRAGLLRSSIEAADGLNRAADLIESAFGTLRREEVGQHAGAGADREHGRCLTGAEVHGAPAEL
jgi:zeaxanthin glucosyltransferase